MPIETAPRPEEPADARPQEPPEHISILEKLNSLSRLDVAPFFAVQSDAADFKRRLRRCRAMFLQATKENFDPIAITMGEYASLVRWAIGSDDMLQTAAPPFTVDTGNDAEIAAMSGWIEPFLKQRVSAEVQRFLGNVAVNPAYGPLRPMQTQSGEATLIDAEALLTRASGSTRAAVTLYRGFFEPSKDHPEQDETKRRHALLHEIVGHGLDPRYTLLANDHPWPFAQSLGALRVWNTIVAEEPIDAVTVPDDESHNYDYVVGQVGATPELAAWKRTTEDFAETMAFAAYRPDWLAANLPRRAEFARHWLAGAIEETGPLTA